MDTKILENAGLSYGEVEVYLCLLKHGSLVVTKIASLTGLHRTNIYDTLEKLREKGLVASLVRENRQYFSASDPTRLVDFVKEREQELLGALPELLALRKISRSQSCVELYQGKAGLKAALHDITKVKKDYVVFEEKGSIQRVLPHFYPQFNVQMNKAKIRVRVLTQDSSLIASRSLMQIRTLPHFVAFPAATAVYGNNIAIFVWDEPYHAILIRSKQVAESYRQFFEALWKNAKK